jgi:hypothetical protein
VNRKLKTFEKGTTRKSIEGPEFEEKNRFK